MRTKTHRRDTVTDLTDPVMYSDPFPHYAALRRDAPISPVHAPSLARHAYIAVRFDDVMKIHTDKRFSSDLMKHTSPVVTALLPKMFRLLTTSMVFKDDPEHKRLRGLVNRAFTPKMIQRMTESIEARIDQLIEGFAGEETIDLVESFAVPLPLSMIANMLGVGDADRDDFHHWTKALVEGFGSGPVATVKALPTSRRLRRLFERLADEARGADDDNLITGLIGANDNGDVLNNEEVVAMIFLLLLAGHDTTANLIGNGVLALLDNRDQLDRLRAEPDLIDTAVEELLRFTSPVTCGATRIIEDGVELGGMPLGKGTQVLGMIISANRDETAFDQPDTLDLGRDPNRHLAFAFGTHYCLGNQLARIEGRLAFGALVQRFPDLALAAPRETLRYKPTPSLRGLTRLPLRLHASQRERLASATGS